LSSSRNSVESGRRGKRDRPIGIPRKTAASRQTASQCGCPASVMSARYSNLTSGSKLFHICCAPARSLRSWVSSKSFRARRGTIHRQAGNIAVHSRRETLHGDDVDAHENPDIGPAQELGVMNPGYLHVRPLHGMNDIFLGQHVDFLRRDFHSGKNRHVIDHDGKRYRLPDPAEVVKDILWGDAADRVA